MIYTAHEIDCSEFASSQEIVEALRVLAAGCSVRQVARVTLAGVRPPSMADETSSVYDAVAQDFEYLDLIDATVPQEDYEGLARETTSRGIFVRRMNEEIHDAPDPERRRLLERTREAGLAAYRGQKLAIRGCEPGRRGR